MIKFLFSSILAVSMTAAVCAQAPADKKEAAKTDSSAAAAPAKETVMTAAHVPGNAAWDFFSFTFVPENIPFEANNSVIYGFRIGVPIGFGKDSTVSGTELSLFGSMSSRVNGVQGACLYNTATRVDGLQAAPIVNIADDVNGVQFSIVNISKDSAFQIGIVNYIKNSPVPVLPIINVRF